jgi:hypothetical protein
MLHAHERAVTRLEQKVRIDQLTQERRARGGIEAPQALRLRLRQPKSRHFEKFSLHPTKDLVFRWTLPHNSPVQ